VVYFAQAMLDRKNSSLEGLACALSGAGNVALHTAAKLVDRGASVITLSDAGGFVHNEKGFSDDEITRIREMKRERGSIRDFAEETKYDYEEGRAWKAPCDAAFPCATQNELEEDDAVRLLENGCRFVCEGANMPTTDEAEERFREAGILFGPSKAANAGGVAVSEFEMAQAASRQQWGAKKVDKRLRKVMEHIHDCCVEHGEDGDRVDYAAGASRAAFVRIADALLRF
jgi:glutamate dehydrogenase (NADP+)